MDYNEERILEERKQKQTYLKAEIIDAGYDGAQFAEFLNSKKEEGGSNIDMWSFIELKKLVKEFQVIMQEYLAHTAADENNYEYVDNQQQGQEGVKSQEEVQSPAPIHESSGINDMTKDETYSKIVNVKKTIPGELSAEKNLKIIVGDPELVKGGLFSASYIQYRVTTQPFGWVVRRRFSDFFWLRSTLQKLHMGYVVPPVPKKSNKGKFENDFIRKRMYFLEKFLNSCAANEDFKADKNLYYFLYIMDDNQFKNKKKDADKIVRTGRLEEVSNTLGEIQMEINPNLKYYAANVGELCNQTDPIYKKIRKLSKQLSLDLDQVSNTVFSIGECYAALYAASTNFNKNVNVGKNPNLDDIYLTLNNMMVSWGEQVLGQIKIVQKNMIYFYKYAHYENESFRELVQGRSKTGLEYIQKKKELIAKKEKLFTQGDLNKWELSAASLKEYPKEVLLKNKILAMEVMLPRETAAVRELRDMFAYQNAMTYSEVDKALHEKCKQYSTNFHELAKLQTENLTEVHVHWADLMAHFTDTKLKPKTAHIMDRSSVRPREDEKNFGQFEED